MQGIVPLTQIGKGHVERLGRDQYLAVIKTNRRGYHEIAELDPHSAQQAAQDFCALNGISLQIFTVPPEVIRAHLADIGDFLADHEGEKVRAEYVPGIRKAI